MKLRRKILLVGIFLAFALFPSFFVTPAHAAEPSLETILDNLGFANRVRRYVGTFSADTYNITLYAEFAAYYETNNLCYYELNCPSVFNLIFNGSEGGYGYIDPIAKVFTADYEFGLSMGTEEYRYFTERSKNPDGLTHAKVYENLDDPGMYLIGFENLFGWGGDRDFNDMVLSLRPCAPVVEYYLTVISLYGTAGGEGLYPSGATAYATSDTGIVDHGNGTRRVFTHWSGDASGTNYANSNPITMNSNKTAIANWKTQHYLTMSTNYGTASPEEGWHDSGSIVSISATPPSTISGERYVWNGWTGAGTGSYSGTNNPASITVNGPITEAASWTHQYYLTIISSYGTPSGEDWYDSGSTAYVNLDIDTVDHGNGTRRLFISWSGDASGTNYALSDPILMDGPKTAISIWKSQYYLTLTMTSGGVTAPSSSAWYDTGTIVSVTAIPDTYYLLDHWELDSTPVGSSNTYGVTMDTSHTLHAVFVQEMSTLTITVTAGGTTNPSPGAHVFPSGTYVVVTAIPEEHYVFDHWELDGLPVGSESPYSVFLNPDHTLHAVFTLTSYTLTINSATGGTTNPTAGVYVHTAGSNVQVSAIPDTDYIFDHWILDGGNAGSANPVNIQMYANHELEPLFVYSPPTPPTYYLTVKTNPPSVTAISGEGWYDESENVVLTSPATVSFSTDARYRFTYWDIDGTPQGTGVNPITVAMDANHTATAHYVLQYFFTVASPYGSPTPSSGWFDAGTGIIASVASPVSGPAGTRHVCTGWSGTGSTPTAGTTTSTGFTINGPSSITWNWKTQYFLTVETDPLGVAIILGQNWYDAAAVVPLSAPSVGGYSFLNWDIDEVSQGVGVSLISVTMNSPHTATAYYKLKVVVVGGSTVPLQIPLLRTWMSLNLMLIAAILISAFWMKRRRRKNK